jgi:hypothetical protein
VLSFPAVSPTSRGEKKLEKVRKCTSVEEPPHFDAAPGKNF